MVTTYAVLHACSRSGRSADGPIPELTDVARIPWVPVFDAGAYRGLALSHHNAEPRNREIFVSDVQWFCQTVPQIQTKRLCIANKSRVQEAAWSSLMRFRVKEFAGVLGVWERETKAGIPCGPTSSEAPTFRSWRQ